MYKNFTIKNFRNFDNTGATFQLSPITILTGCNSAGKSSMVKALLLLSNCFKNVIKTVQNKSEKKLSVDDFKLDFTDKQLKLGRYDIALNNKARKGDPMVFNCEVYSEYLNENLNIEYTFRSDPKDNLNNGWLKAIKILNQKGDVFYWLDIDSKSLRIDFSTIRDAFKSYILEIARLSINYSHDPIKVSEELLLDSAKLLLSSEISSGNGDEADLKSMYLGLINSNSKEYYKIRKKIDSYSHPDGEKYYIDLNKDRKLFHCISDYIKYNTMFYLPLLESLQRMSKSEVIQWFKSQLNERCESEYERIKNILPAGRPSQIGILRLEHDANLMMDDFKKSKHSSFLDYYLEKEVEHLNFIKTLETNKKNIESMVASSYHAEDLLDLSCFNNLFSKGPDDFDYISSQHLYHDFVDAGTLFSTDFAPSQDMQSYEEWEVYLMNQKKNIQKKKECTFQLVYGLLTYFSDEEFSIHGHHLLFERFILFAQHILGCIVPDAIMNMNYVGSSRVNIQRLYSFDDVQSDFSALCLKYLESKKKFIGTYNPDSFMNYWVKRFNLGDRVSVSGTDYGFGIMVKLYRDKKDLEGHLLADEGYGITQLVSLLLQIETSILSAKTKIVRGEKLLPCRIEDIDDIEKKEVFLPQTIAIEEPEIHLHPKYQSLLADMFLDVYQKYNINFIIETHSEYLIRKSQAIVANMNFKSNSEADTQSPFRTYYLPSDGQPYSLGYRADGKFMESFGPGFYDEAASLMFEIM